MSDKIYSEGYEKRVDFGPADATKPAWDAGGLIGAALNPYRALGKTASPISFADELRNRLGKTNKMIVENATEAKRLIQLRSELEASLTAIAALSPMPEAGEGMEHHERFPAGKVGRDYESGLVDGATYLGERSEDRTPAYLDGLSAGRQVRDAQEADPLADAMLDIAVEDGLAVVTPQPATPEQGLGEIENTEGLLDHEQEETSEPSSQESSTDAASAKLHLDWTPFSKIEPEAPARVPGYVVESTHDDVQGEWVFRHRAEGGETPSELETQGSADGDREEQTTSPDSSDAQVFAHGILNDAERKASEPKRGLFSFGGTKSFAKPEGAL